MGWQPPTSENKEYDKLRVNSQNGVFAERVTMSINPSWAPPPPTLLAPAFCIQHRGIGDTPLALSPTRSPDRLW